MRIEKEFLRFSNPEKSISEPPIKEREGLKGCLTAPLLLSIALRPSLNENKPPGALLYATRPLRARYVFAPYVLNS